MMAPLFLTQLQAVVLWATEIIKMDFVFSRASSWGPSAGVRVAVSSPPTHLNPPPIPVPLPLLHSANT